MKRTPMAVTSLLLPALGWAASPLDGTWRADLDKTRWPDRPDVFTLQNGLYTCKTCAPPYTVKADGLDQVVTGHPYYDSLEVTVIDERTVLKTAKHNGKQVISEKFVVSPDGNTATDEMTDSSGGNAGPTTATKQLERVAAGPPGSHAISGSWRTRKMQMSDNAVTLTFKTTSTSITMTNQTGQSFTARLDGTDAPYLGDPGMSKVSVRKIDRRTIEETDKRGSQVVQVIRWTVTADGKTIHARFDDRLHGVVTNMVGHKLGEG